MIELTFIFRFLHALQPVRDFVWGFLGFAIRDLVPDMGSESGVLAIGASRRAGTFLFVGLSKRERVVCLRRSEVREDGRGGA